MQAPSGRWRYFGLMYLGTIQLQLLDNYCNSGDTCRVLKGSELHTTDRALLSPLTFKPFDQLPLFM